MKQLITNQYVISQSSVIDNNYFCLRQLATSRPADTEKVSIPHAMYASQRLHSQKVVS